ncbi:Acetyltransferase (GNAT) domain/Acetyltransferase (GNAT) family [Novymonas esmeraldas]|uniref:Acetyltransferase (GNAT) domain/Acetyltransferase (GNAT) family n=1 Tax=Novymonas esmeraldas TaxID=1808958 RepID=A0AAW0EVI8_9TRYP
MINEHVCLIGPELVLVPYLRPFVPQYHSWMCDPVLLAATESEPLSLDEEHENQISWLQSVDKMTFILLAPTHAPPTAEVQTQARDAESQVEERRGVAQRVVLQGSVPPLAEVFAPLSSQRSSTGSPCSGAPASASRGSIVTTDDHVSVTAESGLACAAGGAYPLLTRYAPSHAKELFCHGDGETTSSTATSLSSASAEAAQQRALAQTYVMIGDCNLFLLEEEEEEEENEGTGGLSESAAVDWSTQGTEPHPPLPPRTSPAHDSNAPHASPSPPSPPPLSSGSSVAPARTFEVEVMVAETAFRRRGLAEAAVRMMMQYAIAVCGATRFVAKILDTNAGSIALFTQRLGFTPFKRVAVFHELHCARSLRTTAERLAWEQECRRGGRATDARADAGAPVADRTYWCAPLDDTVASKMRVYTHVP